MVAKTLANKTTSEYQFSGFTQLSPVVRTYACVGAIAAHPPDAWGLELSDDRVARPRIPRSWAYNLNGAECDHKETISSCCARDLSGEYSRAPSDFVQVAINGVVMGDRKVVSIAWQPEDHGEGTHRGGEICLDGRSPLSPGVEGCGHLHRRRGAPVGGRLRDRGRPHAADVAEEGAAAPGAALIRSAGVDREWSRRGLPQSASKATLAPRFEKVWGAELVAIHGILGFQSCRRASLVLMGVFGVAEGMSGAVLQQLIDNLAFALSFRREACAALRSVCTAARARRGKRFLRICWAAAGRGRGCPRSAAADGDQRLGEGARGGLRHRRVGPVWAPELTVNFYLWADAKRADMRVDMTKGRRWPAQARPRHHLVGLRHAAGSGVERPIFGQKVESRPQKSRAMVTRSQLVLRVRVGAVVGAPGGLPLSPQVATTLADPVAFAAAAVRHVG